MKILLGICRVLFNLFASCQVFIPIQGPTHPTGGAFCGPTSTTWADWGGSVTLAFGSTPTPIKGYVHQR